MTMERFTKIIICGLMYTLFTLATAEDKFIFKPSHYNLEIITFPQNFKDDPKAEDLRFNGSVQIDLDIIKNTQNNETRAEIILNSNPNITVFNVTIKGLKQNTWENILPISQTKKNDKLHIGIEKYNSTIVKYQLIIVFSNLLRNDMTGFYRSSYTDSLNKTRWLLTTHFEPIYARLVFPCFDRPDLKAKFDIKITAPKVATTVLCNTPTDGGKLVGDNKIFTCRQTLEMSTYLVAFTVSNLIGTKAESFSSNYPDNLRDKKRTLTTYGREDIINKNEGKLAQTTGLAAITELGKYLDLGYAFEKIDQVGIPDFSAGAMENWGHISFREKALFFNDSTGSTLTKQANVLTITHELVHQWFGNLVTLESWDYIWLNEAFANYLEYVIASKFTDPNSSKWDLFKQFVVTEIHSRAFETDGLASSKPLNNKITDESLILPSFNDIPYAKGATVLRMWENAMGCDKFQQSLRKYVRERALNTSNPKVLYEYFKKNTQMNELFFTSWTDQAGYPVVEVKKNANGLYKFTQKRFFWEKSTSEAKWYIPISYLTDTNNGSEAPPQYWLYKDSLEINITGKWFIVNNHQYGYYRVNYEKENWNALSDALLKSHNKINEINRAQIINDVYSLARSLQENYVEYKTALTLTEYLKNEGSFSPWKTALNAFDFLRTKLRQTKVDIDFNKYVSNLVEPHFKSLNLKTENHIEKLKNIEMYKWGCSLGLDACVKTAENLFKNSTYVKYPDIQEVVLCVAVKNLNAWDAVLNKYSKETDSSLKLMYINALGCTRNKAQAEKFLADTLRENCIIRSQDLSYALSSVYNGNPDHVDMAFKFISDNYKAIAQKYGGINPLGKAVVGIARKINTNDLFKKLNNLVEEIRKGEEGKAAKDSLNNALDIAKSNVEWVNKRADQIYNYFNAGSYVTYSLSLLIFSFVSSQFLF